MFALDHKVGKIVYAQWASNGALSQGEAYYEGEVLLFPDRVKPGELSATGRSRWIRLDADAYKVTREKWDGDRWSETLSVVYRRR